ncbi:BZ3500_MvSof-1268-A1-R1_Chr11-3g03571 [Microbotryum saponariae]|uniref:BZ3500_MvSof-1268-A1-R1_Chr11-3g03571 protein n=1 Tax=Microbotryum saponariae TaxID=289078 RepID=A0A2X0LGC4_9BASI|nr:BZ3500_MvSof-1268-A1-R1_Chr11-3g03571 [Microbotryum saponariae]SDA03580.1 BZ3501_MvSof-1269-A2-R1_Chr11g03148 [Microbotryum saponariae]
MSSVAGGGPPLFTHSASSSSIDRPPEASTSSSALSNQHDRKRPRASTSKMPQEPTLRHPHHQQQQQQQQRAGSGGHDEDKVMANGGEEEENIRKRRLALSCELMWGMPYSSFDFVDRVSIRWAGSECQRRKIKCDRKQPCSACIRRKVAHNCNWDDDPDSSGQFALNSDVRHIHRRLAHLESLVQGFHPEAVLLPNLNDSTSASAMVLGAAMDSQGTRRAATNPLTSEPNSPRTSRRSSQAIRESDAQHRSQQTARQSEDQETRQDPHSDTEDAVADLESVAFGARVPVLQAVNAAAEMNASRPVQSRVGIELTSALTSIIAEPLSYDQDGRPRSAVRLGLDLAVPTKQLPDARSEAMAQIFAVLPGKEIARFLIDKYFDEMEWDFRILDPVAFPIEHERYVEMIAEGREDSIDPLWVAVFCMASLLGFRFRRFWSRSNGKKDLSLFHGLTERELQDLPSVFHDASLRALQLGEWGGTPRIRTIQTIILFGQYIQLSSQSGQQGRFLGWAASGIRIAQRMGLHRLGSNPRTMPPDDPALPPGVNSLKRETAVRVFNYLVLIDSFLSDSAVFRCYILHPSQYNTCRPLNLNFDDLSRTEWRTITPPPKNVYTDASFEIAQCELGAQVRRVLDELVLSGKPFSYSAVMEQDALFRRVFEGLPDVLSTANPPVESVQIRYQRSLLHEDVYARLVRLHRPFLLRGYGPTSPYRYSTSSCVDASRSIIRSNYDLLSITGSLWWMFTSSMRATIVCFMDLFHAIDTDRPEVEIKEKRAVLMQASVIFATQVHSPALQAVVEQGRRILSGLFAAEENRRTTLAAHTLAGGGVAPAQETFAQVLKRVSNEIAREERALFAATSNHLPPSPFPPPSSASSSATSAPFVTHQLAYGAPAADPGAFEYWSSMNHVNSNFPNNQQQGGNSASPSMSSYVRTPTSFPLVGGPVGTSSATAINGQDFASFFETLASKDWANAAGLNGSDGGQESGLLGQMAATW